MSELLEKLYSYEYFGIYLMISIIVLILLFVIILFLGKKDQKEREIEATKKLQQLNSEDTFKEENNVEKVEVPNENINTLENDTIIVPTIEDVPNIINEENEIPEPVLPVQEEITNVENEVKELETPIIEETDIAVEQNIQPIIEEVKPEEVITPLLDKIEEKPLAFSEIYTEEESKIEEVPKIEEVKPIEKVTIEPSLDEMEVPTFNFDEIVKGVEETKKEQTYTKGPEIFSSVYAPEKEEVRETPSINEDLGIELPTLKKEEPKQEEVKNEKIEMPVLNDYNLDELSGETYTIK